MTETVCPICHSRVESHMSDWNFSYTPLPSPDLTKLREAWNRFEHNIDTEKFHSTYIFLLDAVKELLEGNK